MHKPPNPLNQPIQAIEVLPALDGHQIIQLSPEEHIPIQTLLKNFQRALTEVQQGFSPDEVKISPCQNHIEAPTEIKLQILIPILERLNGAREKIFHCTFAKTNLEQDSFNCLLLEQLLTLRYEGAQYLESRGLCPEMITQILEKGVDCPMNQKGYKLLVLK